MEHFLIWVFYLNNIIVRSWEVDNRKKRELIGNYSWKIFFLTYFRKKDFISSCILLYLKISIDHS